MKNLFRHIVITRFNIKPVNLVTGELVRSSFEDKWMEERISYLRDYCLPSILNQECDNFDWLIYLDSTTNKKYRKIIEQIVKSRGFRSHVEFTDNAVTFVSDLRNKTKNLAYNDEYIITTRLDSDDAFHENAITQIQTSFQSSLDLLKQKPRFAINLVRGYQLRVSPYYELVHKKLYSNPFISLAEKLDQDVLTIYSYFHNDLKDTEIVNIEDGFYWLQTVHGTNMTTDVIGWPTFRTRKLKEFGIDTSNIYIKPHILLFSLYRRLASSSKLNRVLRWLNLSST